MEYLIALYLAAQQLADDNQRLKTETAKAIEDVQAEANEALKELAGIWRVHCNGLEDRIKNLTIEAVLNKAKAVNAGKSADKNYADYEAEKLSHEETKAELADETVRYNQALAESDEAVGWLNDVQKERDDANRQLQNIRTAFEQLQRAVHPPKFPGYAAGGIIGGGVLGGGIAYGDPRRAIVSGPGWDSILKGGSIVNGDG